MAGDVVVPGLAGQPGADSAKTPLFLFAVGKDQRDTRDERNSATPRTMKIIPASFMELCFPKQRENGRPPL